MNQPPEPLPALTETMTYIERIFDIFREPFNDTWELKQIVKSCNRLFHEENSLWTPQNYLDIPNNLLEIFKRGKVLVQKLQTWIARVENGREEVARVKNLEGKDERGRKMFLQIMRDDLEVAGGTLQELKERVGDVEIFFAPYSP